MTNKNAHKKTNLYTQGVFVSIFVIVGLSLFFALFVSGLIIVDSYESNDNATDFMPIYSETTYEPKYNTWAHDALALEKKYLNRNGGLEELDYFLSTVETKIKHVPHSRDEVLESLFVISEIINNQFYYRVNELLSHGLKSRGIDCDNLSVLYLSAAQVIGFDLDLVYMPNHMLIKWSNDDQLIYWETTVDKDHERELEDLYVFGKINQKTVLSAKYLKPLNDDETRALFYHNMANFSYTQRLSKTLMLSQKSIELDPDNYLLQISNQYFISNENQSFSGLEIFDEFIKQDPNYAVNYGIVGGWLYRMGDIDKAISYLEKATTLGNSSYNYKLMKRAYMKKGEKFMAVKYYIKEVFSRINEYDLEDYQTISNISGVNY